MISALIHRLGSRYALIAAAVTFLALLTAAALRSAPGVLLPSWQGEFGWSLGSISLAAAIGIFLYGLVGPFAAALMQRIGVRRTLCGALLLMGASTSASVFMNQPWHLILSWGLISGLGSGCVAMVLAATVVNRWFVTRRGLITGVMMAAPATGSLIFIPLMALIASGPGWRFVALGIGAAALALIPVVLLLLPERPSDAGAPPFGSDEVQPPAPPVTANPVRNAFETLAMAARTRVFWLLFGAFFVCGFTTNGLIGTHMIAFCADNGLPQVRAAGLLALMGIFDLIGVTLSGWLTDRYDARKLLFFYYGLRGLSLFYLPFSDFSLWSLTLFAAFYGLDWIATVPPTLRLTTDAFGAAKAPIVFGWIAAGHQLGAASAAFTGGLIRDSQGRYLEAFMVAGAACMAAAVLSLLTARRNATPQPA